MKNIKYRVRYNNKTYYWGFMEIKTGHVRFASPPEILRLSLQEIRDKSEQFIGLYDINGNEIYEGDIISYNFKTKDNNEQFISEVFFDEFMWVTNEHSLNRINNIEIKE